MELGEHSEHIALRDAFVTYLRTVDSPTADRAADRLAQLHSWTAWASYFSDVVKEIEDTLGADGSMLLACPICGSDRLGMVLSLYGVMPTYVYQDGDGKRYFHTRRNDGVHVDWGTADEMDAVACRNCGWEQDADIVEGKPALHELVPARDIDGNER